MKIAFTHNLRVAPTEEQALNAYRRVRDEIRAFVETLPESLSKAQPRST